MAKPVPNRNTLIREAGRLQKGIGYSLRNQDRHIQMDISTRMILL